MIAERDLGGGEDAAVSLEVIDRGLPVEAIHQLNQFRGIGILGRELEPVLQFTRPFRANCRLAQDEQATGFVTRLPFRPDEAGLNGLAQANFIRDQQPIGGRFDETKNRFELVRVKIDFRRLHRIEDIREQAAKLLERDAPAEVVYRAVNAFPDIRVCVARCIRVEGRELGDINKLGVASPMNLGHGEEGVQGSACQHAESARVRDMVNRQALADLIQVHVLNSLKSATQPDS